MPTVGEVLKQARVERDLTLTDVSDCIMISANFLQAIERNDFKRLPAGIFPKLFIKSYANFLGLDAEGVLRIYFEQLAAAGPGLPTTRPVSRPVTRPPWLVPGVIGLIVLAAAGVAFWLLSTPPPPPAPSAALTSPRSAPPPAATPQPSPPPAAAEPAPAPASAMPSGTSEPGGLRMRLEASQSAWVRLDTAERTWDFILQPGTTFEQRLTGPATLRTGNAGGLRLFLNDSPARPLGGAGEVRTIPLSPDSFRNLLAEPGERR